MQIPIRIANQLANKIVKIAVLSYSKNKRLVV